MSECRELTKPVPRTTAEVKVIRPHSCLSRSSTLALVKESQVFTVEVPVIGKSHAHLEFLMHSVTKQQNGGHI